MPSSTLKDANGQWLSGDDLVSWYRENFGRRTILAFSGGKDSIATALAIREKLDVVPVYRVIVPGLEFIERSLAYYERALFGREIIRVAHGLGWNAIVNQCDMDPRVADHVSGLGLRYMSPASALRMERSIVGDLPVAIGLRAADSVNRQLTLKHHGPFTGKTRKWYPIWDLRRADLVELIKGAGIKLPIDYRIWGRSFDGVEYKYLAPLKKHFPRDFERILEFFPLLEADFVRHERSYH